MASAGESKNDNETNSGSERLAGALIGGPGTPPSQASNAFTHPRDPAMFPASPTAQSGAAKTAQMDTVP
jgi:hypothetical protein